jgi:hypothetical protein
MAVNIGVFSKFYYGYDVGVFSNRFEFNDGGDKVISVPPRVYTPTDLASQIEFLLNEASNDEFEVLFNRETRQFTIESDGSVFEILSQSGANQPFGIYQIIGFSGADRTGTTEYVGVASGKQYVTQFPVQDYVSHLDWIEKIDATVNSSAQGAVELVSFGDTRFTRFEMKFITSKDLKGGEIIRHNPSGLEDARDLMFELIKKGPVEFMLDSKNPDDFIKVVLESTDENTNGTAFRLIEETANNLPDVYRSGLLTFRVV